MIPNLKLKERERYKEPVRESLKALLALNWTVEHADTDAPLSHRGSTRRQSKANVVRFSSTIVNCMKCLVKKTTNLPNSYAIDPNTFNNL